MMRFLLIPLFLAWGSVHAAPLTQYADIVGWGAAVKTYKTDTLYFEPTLDIPGYFHPDGSYGPGPEYTVVDVQYEDFHLFNPHIHYGWHLGSGSIGGEMHVPGFEDSRAQIFTLTFDQPLRAVALNYFSSPGEHGQGGGMISIGNSNVSSVACDASGCFGRDGTGTLHPLAPSDFFFPHGEHFFGIVSDEPFSVLTFTKPYLLKQSCFIETDEEFCYWTSNEDFGYVSVGAISYKAWQVPEPAHLSLVAGCLALLPAFMRRAGSVRSSR